MKKKKTRVIEISIKTDERLVIKRWRSVTHLWCTHCGKDVGMIPLEDLKEVMNESGQQTPSKEFHLTKTSKGVFVCLDSIT